MTIAAELYSEDLITENNYDEAIETNNKTGLERGSSLMNAIKATVNSQPESVGTLIGILLRVEGFKLVAELMNKELL